MQAKIETLKAKNSNDEEYIVYPRTLIKCVTNEHGDNLQDLISDTILEADGRVYVDYGSHEETDEYVPVNADTLDGHGAEYYATAKSVSDITDGTTVVGEATKATFDGEGNKITETYLPKTGTAVDSTKLGGKVANEYALGTDLANHVYNSTTVNTDEEFEALLQTLHANAKDGSYYEHKVVISYQHSVIGGGHRTIEGFRQSSNYGYVVVKAWKTDRGCYIYTRSIINGTWKDWELLATTADLANYAKINDLDTGTYPIGAAGRNSYIAYTTDGHYIGSVNVVTGRLRIQLPIHLSLSRFRISVNSYDWGQCDYYIGMNLVVKPTESYVGFNSPQVWSIGSSEVHRNLPVAFGYDNNFVPYVLIGEDSTTWRMPSVAINDVSGYCGAICRSGWKITFTEDNSDITVSNLIRNPEGYLPSSPVKITGRTTDDLVAIYDNLHNNARDRGEYSATIYHNVSHPELGGGTWLLHGYRQSSTHGIQIAYGYYGVRVRTLVGGTWGSWEADITSLGGRLGDGTKRKPIDVKGTDDSVIGFLDKNGTLLGSIGVHANKKPIFDSYDILHTGNKPTGGYTGNGDSTERTITVGENCIGNLLMIQGNTYGCIVHEIFGAVYYNKDTDTVNHIPASEVSYSNGILTLKTTRAGLNASGMSYWYRVI